MSHTNGKLILLKLVKYYCELTKKRFVVWCEAFWTTYCALDACSFKYRNQIHCSPHVSAEYYPVQLIQTELKVMRNLEINSSSTLSHAYSSKKNHDQIFLDDQTHQFRAEVCFKLIQLIACEYFIPYSQHGRFKSTKSGSPVLFFF
jgi:hypothetical protein